MKQIRFIPTVLIFLSLGVTALASSQHVEVKETTKVKYGNRYLTFYKGQKLTLEKCPATSNYCSVATTINGRYSRGIPVLSTQLKSSTGNALARSTTPVKAKTSYMRVSQDMNVSINGKRTFVSAKTALKASNCSVDKCVITVNGTDVFFPKKYLKQWTNNNTKKQVTSSKNRLDFSSPICECTRGSCYITSKFSKRRYHPKYKRYRPHTGVDLGGGLNTPIVASESGLITLARRKGGYGKTIEIAHSSGYSTLYAHLNKYVKTTGWVNKGDLIGYMGSTGVSTGPHLHFEIRKSGVPLNPISNTFISSADIKSSVGSCSGSKTKYNSSKRIIAKSSANNIEKNTINYIMSGAIQ